MRTPSSTFRSPGVVALALLIAGQACNTNATIVRRDEGSLVARIELADRRLLCVTGESGDSLLVERSTVADIRHPGRNWLIAGAVFEIVGATLLATGLYQANRSTSGAAGPALVSAGGASVMLEGLPMLVWGAIAQSRSRRAAAPSDVDLRGRCPQARMPDRPPQAR